MQFLGMPMVDPGSNNTGFHVGRFGVHFGVLFWYPGGDHYGRETLLRGVSNYEVFTEEQKLRVGLVCRRASTKAQTG